MFENMQDLKWMLIKSESNYFPNDFPESYLRYKDIDIIFRRDEAEEMVKRIVSFYKKYVLDNYDVRVISEKDRGFRIRLELYDYLIFQVDISYSIEGLKDRFYETVWQGRFKKKT